MEAIDREFDRANAEAAQELHSFHRSEAFRKKYNFLADVVAVQVDGVHALVFTRDGECHYVESADLPTDLRQRAAQGGEEND